MSYNQLRTILKTDKSLKVLPLVDSSEQMILLGSIQRRELVAAIERQVGMDRRLAVKSARRREAEIERKRAMREEKMIILQDQLLTPKVEKSELGGGEVVRMAGRWGIWLLLLRSFINLVVLANTFSFTT